MTSPNLADLISALEASECVWSSWPDSIDAGNVDRVRRAAMTAALHCAALRGVSDEPGAGWKLVPVEPTATMIAAALIDGSDDPDHEASSIGHQWVREAIYRAMLDAAPEPAMPDTQSREGDQT